MKTFKIEIRKTCKICGVKLTKLRTRTFCSKKCRDAETNKRTASYQQEWQRNRRGKYEEGKIQCLICGKWYHQIGSHVKQFHKITARKYREAHDLEVKKGMLSPALKEKKARQAIENGTYKNLAVGKKFWFKKGSKTAGRYHRSHITLERLSNLGKKYGKQNGGKNRSRKKVQRQPNKSWLQILQHYWSKL